MTGIDTQNAEALLRHRDWLRALARHLVADEARADDVCQDALLGAIGRAEPPVSPRSWLARAVRSLAARQARDEGRRCARERDAAVERTVPATAEVVAQFASQRVVANAVHALAEPYRSTILLRYWDDLPTRAVARRLGVPVETVRTRVKRGLALLRTRLDHEFGARGAWVAPVTGLLSSSPSVLLPASIVTIVNTKLFASVAAIALLSSLVWLWTRGDPAPPTAAVDEAGTSVASVEPATGPQSGPRRDAVPAATPIDASVEGAPSAPAPVQGRVVDVHSRALAGVLVAVTEGVGGRPAAGTPANAAADASTSETDDRGRFELPRPARSGRIVTLDPALATVMAAVIEPDSVAEPLVVVAPALQFAGRVVDAVGMPLPRAQVACVLPADFRARFDNVLDFSLAPTWTVHADDRGTFALPAVGRVPGARLVASLAGYLPVELAQPDDSRDGLEFVLRRPEPVAGSLQGQVLDLLGRPAVDAHVALGPAATRTDESGRFVFPVAEIDGNSELIAMKRGHLPGRATVPAALESAFVTVRLGDRPLSIHGVVYDADRRPLAGAKVWIADPTPFGALPGGLGLIALEGYLAGGLLRSELWERFTENGRPTQPVERILDENPTAKWAWTRTDASGQFRLDGLESRDYTIAAMAPDSLVRVVAGPFPAGSTNAILQVQDGAVAARVAGQVVSKAGVPVAGVRVQLASDTVLLEQTYIDATGRASRRSSGRSQPGGAVTTDEAGRFAFEGVGTDGVYLTLSGDPIMPRSFARKGEQPPRLGERTGLAVCRAPRGLDDLRIEVTRRMHLRVELVDPTFADAVGARDEAGGRVRLWKIAADGQDTMTRFPLFDGRSGVLSAPESVTTIVLYQEGVVVREVPVTLVAGEVAVISG